MTSQLSKLLAELLVKSHQYEIACDSDNSGASVLASVSACDARRLVLVRIGEVVGSEELFQAANAAMDRRVALTLSREVVA